MPPRSSRSQSASTWSNWSASTRSLPPPQWTLSTSPSRTRKRSSPSPPVRSSPSGSPMAVTSTRASAQSTSLPSPPSETSRPRLAKILSAPPRAAMRSRANVPVRVLSLPSPMMVTAVAAVASTSDRPAATARPHRILLLRCRKGHPPCGGGCPSNRCGKRELRAASPGPGSPTGFARGAAPCRGPRTTSRPPPRGARARSPREGHAPPRGKHPVALEVPEGAVVRNHLEAVAERLEAPAGAVSAVVALADQLAQHRGALVRRQVADRCAGLVLRAGGGFEQQRGQQLLLAPLHREQPHRRTGALVATGAVESKASRPALGRALPPLEVGDPLAAS